MPTDPRDVVTRCSERDAAWLLMAWGAAPALAFVVSVITGEAARLFGSFRWGGERVLGPLGGWWGSAHWFAMLPGTLITPMLALLVLIGLLRIRQAARIAVVTVGLCCLTEASYYAYWRAVRPITWVAIDVPCVIAVSIIPALLPALLAYSLRRRDGDVLGRLWWGRFTRLVFLWGGAFLLGSSLNNVAMPFFAGWAGERVISLLVWQALALLPIALLFCGACLLVRSKIRRGALWWAGVWAVLAVLIWLIRLGAYVAAYGGGRSVIINAAINMRDALPVPLATGVFIAHWWAVMTGRVSTELCPEGPLCSHCGYNLTGNVSGRCPECGELVRPTNTTVQA